MDLADRAADVSDLWRDLELRQARQRAAESIPSTDRCLNCEAPTAGARWCGPDCRDDYLRREARTSEGR